MKTGSIFERASTPVSGIFDIGSRKQLFVDDLLVDEASRISRFKGVVLLVLYMGYTLWLMSHALGIDTLALPTLDGIWGLEEFLETKTITGWK